MIDNGATCYVSCNCIAPGQLRNNILRINIIQINVLIVSRLFHLVIDAKPSFIPEFENSLVFRAQVSRVFITLFRGFIKTRYHAML